MDDWTYCVQTLPKVSRTFALNISVLRGELHRSILTAYLFCRTVDTVEDAAKLDPKIKTRLLIEFSQLIEDRNYREKNLATWLEECAEVDGSPNDLDLLHQVSRVFNVFDSLPKIIRTKSFLLFRKWRRAWPFFKTSFNSAKSPRWKTYRTLKNIVILSQEWWGKCCATCFSKNYLTCQKQRAILCAKMPYHSGSDCK